MALSKPYTFTASTPATASEVNADFDELYEALNGTSTDVELLVKYNGSSAVLELDQYGAGSILEASVSGSTKCGINNSGQFHSLLTTGTAPMVVASTTVVTNLNADLLDGNHASAFAAFTGDKLLTIAGATPKIVFDSTSYNDWGIRANTNNDLIISDETGAEDRFLFTTAGIFTADSQVRTEAAAPSAANDLTRKDYVDGRQQRWSATAFFPGEVATDDPIPSWIVPTGVSTMYATALKIVRQAGSASGTTTVTVKKNGVSIGTISLTSQGAGVINTNDITDEALSADDVISFDITAAGSHEDVSVSVEGYQQHHTS